MRNTQLKRTCILICFLFAVLIFVQSQKSEALQEKSIENNIRLNHLEKDLNNQQLEMQVDLDRQIVELEDRLKLKNENVEYKKELVGWWLTGLSILITIFGVLIPIGGFIYGRKFIKDTDSDLTRLKNESKEGINQFIMDSKERLLLLEDKAQLYISNLHKYEQAGKDAANRISSIENELNGLSKNLSNTELTLEDKKGFVTKAQELGNEMGISEYDKDFAKALELYYSNDNSKALDKFMEMLNKYPESININRLCDIYFNIGYLYSKLNEKDNAIEYYKKTVSIKPHYSAALYNLGCLYGRNMDFDNSKKYYKKVIETDPNYSTSSFANLIEIYLFEQNFEEAKKYIRIVKESIVDDFSINLLEKILLIFLNNFQGNINDSFEEIKALSNNDPSNVKWTFDLFNDWLLSESSHFLSTKQRALLVEFIKLFDNWMQGISK